MSRSNVVPSGPSKVPTATLISEPWWTGRSGTWRNRVNLEQSRLAALGPGQGCPDQVPEQRVGTVGTALELGVGLGADPERMAGQLDELDEAVVGRGARATKSRFLQALA